MTATWAGRWSMPVRAVVWTLGVCDHASTPSLSKMLAFAFGVVLAHDMWLHGVGVQNTAAMALDMSAAFGRSMYLAWLGRNTWTSAVSHTAVDTTTRAITERRDVALGAEPA